MWLATISGIPLLAAYYYWLIPQSTDWPTIVGVRWALVFAGLHFLAAISAYLGGREGNGFWQFNWRIFLRFCLATLYSGVLLAGLELALVSADKLFELNLSNSYFYLFAIMAGCFQPAFFLSGVPRDFEALEDDAEHPRGLKVFTQFALAPLVAVYTVILYAYAIKILLARTWPHGFVAMPVLILAGVGILCALLLYPLRSSPGEKWASWFCKNFPRALAPLSLLLLLSLRERIADYGVTEDRYLCIVSGFWIIVWALVYIVRKDAGIRWVPASLAVICLAAAFGPWSAGTISRDSQYRRLTKAFRSHGLMIADEFHAPRQTLELPAKESEDIRSTIQYLVSMHGGESVHRLFGKAGKGIDWPKLTPWEVQTEIWVKLNLGSATGGNYAELNYSLKPDETSNVEGFRRVTNIANMYNPNAEEAHGGLTLSDDDLRMKAPGEADAEPVPLDAFIKSLPDNPAGIEQLTSAQMTLNWSQKGRPYRILFTELSVRRQAGKPPRISRFSCMLFEP
jgi:hypothetical protein